MARPQAPHVLKMFENLEIHFVVLIAGWELGTLLQVSKNYSHMEAIARLRQPSSHFIRERS
jgi:hypothetical protein